MSKQQTTNTFSDGLNLDLHPIVTPNSVLTDNLNGTFITYNGNEFCLQNDRGNDKVASLKAGYTPIGIKEHNGVLYIISCNDSGRSEIGTYPGLDWGITKETPSNLDFDNYTPLKNMLKTGGVLHATAYATNIFKFYTENYPLETDYINSIWTLWKDANSVKLNELYAESMDYGTILSDARIKELLTDGIRLFNSDSSAIYRLLIESGLFVNINWSTYDSTDDIINADPDVMVFPLNTSDNIFYDWFNSISNPYYLELLSEQDIKSLFIGGLNAAGEKAYEYERAIDETKHELANIPEISNIEFGYVDSSYTDDFNTDILDLDINHPLQIEIQDSYDGSVNIIFTDNKNKPRIVNSSFAVLPNNKYKLLDSNKTYVESTIDSTTNLILGSTKLTKFDLNSVKSGGQLKGGNYTFYLRYGDLDGNKTDIICQSRTVSIFNGNIGEPSSNHGTLADERTDKLVVLDLSNLDTNYNNIYISYSREYSDTGGYLMYEVKELEKPFKITGESTSITISGYENETSISEEDVNIQYHSIGSAKSLAQQQSMLFIGNIKSLSGREKELQKLSYGIVVTCENKQFGDFDLYKYNGHESYYEPKDIYYNVGYWPDELYRFGIVYLLNDGSKTEAFNLKGCDIDYLNNNSWNNNFGNGHMDIEFDSDGNITNADNGFVTGSARYDNIYGVFSYSRYDRVYTGGSIVFFKFTLPQNMPDYIIGYEIVRQKRIPIALFQGLSIPIESYSGLPIVESANNIIIGNTDTGSKYYTESFLIQRGTNIKKLNYINEYLNIGKSSYDPVKYQVKTSIKRIAFTKVWYSNHVRYTQNSATGKKYIYLLYDKNDNLINVSTTQFPGSMPTNVTLGEDYYFNAVIDHFLGIDPHIPIPGYFSWNGAPESEATSDRMSLSDSYIDRCIHDLFFNADRPREIQGIIDALGQYNAHGGSFDYTETPEDNFNDHIIVFTNQDSISNDSFGILSSDVELDNTLAGMMNGNEFNIVKRADLNSTSKNRHIVFEINEILNTNTGNHKTVFIPWNTQSKFIDGEIFKNIAGNANETNAIQFLYENSGSIQDRYNKDNTNILRGMFTPYVGIVGEPNGLGIYEIRRKISDLSSEFIIRFNDSSPFYAVSDLTDKSISATVSSGDCYIVHQTHRIVRNFINPNGAETAETILDADSWKDNYQGYESNTHWDDINIGDLNTVSIGHWVSFSCLSNYNIGLRSLDPFHTDEYNLMGVPRSFYPINGGSTGTQYKIPDSTLLNAGYNTSVGRIRNQIFHDIPYVKNEFSTRVMFSNINVTDQFINGYRVFQGLSYHDYDKQYGEIVKLLPWGNNLFCAFEHGLAILPINEKALMQTTTEQTIHIYGHGVLPDQMSIISQDFGTKYADSIVRTPIGIYGVDTDAKKIWRFSDKGFETLSDMKIETFLNETLPLTEFSVSVGDGDIRSHYNAFKGDIMFTWYYEQEEYSICFNERQNIWTTRYDWVPIVSDNAIGKLYSLYPSDNIYGIYKHDITADTTKWYDKQHVFEFEFVVSDPIGIHKIFENLQILSNNVQPEELQFEIIGDSYQFNKGRIYHSTLTKEDVEDRFAEARKFTSELIDIQYDVDVTNNTEDPVYNKPTLVASSIKPFRNASRLNDRGFAIYARIKKEPITGQYHIVIPQECRNQETNGVILGNIKYREDSWLSTIEPLIYDARLDDPNAKLDHTDNVKWRSARIRDKWCKIRVRYSGEDLAVITAIKTIVNI